ncbi:MAG: hypothetical protein MRY83_19855 [Flavobacteriales bacterium]|nr:hypothetical protein [Flavobacteriales bacterium]
MIILIDNFEKRITHFEDALPKDSNLTVFRSFTLNPELLSGSGKLILINEDLVDINDEFDLIKLERISRHGQIFWLKNEHYERELDRIIGYSINGYQEQIIDKALLEKNIV